VAGTKDPLRAPVGNPVLNILYVEDNALVREVTSELLAQDDRQICACESAEEALKRFSEEPFDLVITDVSLPIMSGIDLVRSILCVRPQMPIILASGYALDFGLENWGSHVRSIIKPFDPGDIDALIGQIVR
jgi:two-component system, cell cycle response regulator CpdR